MTATRTAPTSSGSSDKPAAFAEPVKTIADLLLAQPKEARITPAVASKVLKDAGIKPDEPVSDEQLRRASIVEETKAGLVGKARAHWMVTGEDGATQLRTAASARGRGKGKTSSGAEGGARGPRPGSTMHSVLIVLKEAKGALSSDEILERMKKKKLAGNLKGKTPVATINAQLCVALKKGQHGIARPERGKWLVAK